MNETRTRGIKMANELMLSPSAEETKADTARGKLEYSKRLVAALGDGRDWEYAGQCTDLQRPVGKCCCGHEGIRYEFMIRNTKTGSLNIVGSSCINHFSDVNPALVASITAALDQLESAAAERKAAARKLTQEAEVQAELTKLSELSWKLDTILATGAESFTYRDWTGKQQIGFRQVRRVTREVFFGWHDCGIAAKRIHDRTEGKQYPFRFKQYKQIGAFLRAIRKDIAAIENLLTGRIWE